MHDPYYLLPVVLVLYVGFLSILVLIDGVCGWPLARAFGYEPTAKCPICGDPQGEGACEGGPCR